jgi:hypothetical protein
MTYDRKQVTATVLFVSVFFCLSSLVIGHWSAREAIAQVNVATKNIPTNITLVWEASSYVPPFYKGKALMPDGGDARVVALLPPGIRATSETSYSWRVDGVVDGARSGIGRSIYEIRSAIFGGSSLVVVEVSDTNGLIGTGALRIPLAEPYVLVYADAPLGGVLFNVENPSINGEELAMETYPLFFTTEFRANPNLSYIWEVNGSTVTNPLGNNGRLVLRSEEEAGTTTIGVSITNHNRILENASGKTTIFLE